MSTRLRKLLAPSRPRTSSDEERAMLELRTIVLTDGLGEQLWARPLIWKLLLGVTARLDADGYAALIGRGESPYYSKIRNDTFRTLATDVSFKDKVGEDRLVRLLEAFVWRNTNAVSGELSFSYVQGMNVLAAPFLYTLPSELEAFHCFSRFIELSCPLYVQPTLEGVHHGLKLVDTCLEIVDAELFTHLRSCKLSAELYAFPSLLTFCACTPPLEQVLHLWDFLLAFGVHMNVLCVIAQLFLMREELLATTRTFPPLRARECIKLAVAFLPDLPSDVYAELVRHPFEPSDAEPSR